MKKKLLIIILISVSCFWISSAHSKDEDLSINFGLMKKDQNNHFYVYKETVEIPFSPQTRYPDFFFGYTIKHSKGEKFKFQTILKLPSVLKEQHGAMNKESTKDLQIFKSEPKSNKSFYKRSYRFDETDPKGEWSLEFYVNDKLFKTVSFVVLEKN